jgi:hypothetical protein
VCFQTLPFARQTSVARDPKHIEASRSCDRPFGFGLVRHRSDDAILVAQPVWRRDNNTEAEGRRCGIRPQTPKGMVESITAIPRRLGAWLALLALALQLGLSTGHVHKVGLDWGHTAGLSSAKLIIGGGDGRSPAENPAAPAEDQCPICFGLAVSGTSILAAALTVILPSVLETARFIAAPQPILLVRRYFSPAQQRAPPPVATPA